jgi:hypothetical protein
LIKEPRLLTCWPVFTEASWLLRNEPGVIEALGELVWSGAVRLVELDEQPRAAVPHSYQYIW